MAFEIPLDQIKQLQVLLRKEVNLSWYEPEKEDPFTLPKLPSVAETIAGLDPSPPYLRCKNCKGKLLRGLQSSICVFCGTNPHKALPPDPIKFKDTVGYRCLLDSLHLDGSEMVGPIAKGNESNRGRSASKDEIPLSELLDLEIRRPSELDGPQTSNSDEAAFQSKGSLNLAAVDLDSFFSQRKSASEQFEEQLASKKQMDSTADNTFQTNENLSFFQNVQVPETTAGSTEGQSGNSFSGWEANFQSASSGAVHKVSESFDHSAADLDEIFVSGKASLGVKKNDSLNPSASIENDWFQGDIERTSNSEVTGQTGKPEVTVDPNYAKMAESANSSSTRNLDWMQDGQGQGSYNKTTDIVTTDEVADSLDAWDEFTGSASTQDASSSVSNSMITSQTKESEVTADLNDTKTAESTHSSSVKNFDWMQDDPWQGTNNKTSSTVATDEAADSINAWDDFMGSAGTQDQSSSVSNSLITSQTGKSEMTADLNDTKTAKGTHSSSTKNFDWMQDDHWQGSNNKTPNTVATNEVADSINAWDNFMGSAGIQDPSSSVSNSVITSQTGKSEITADLNGTKTAEGTKNFDWMGDDLWQGSNDKTTDTVTNDEVADSFDDWDGFTSSATTHDPSSNVWKQTVNQTSAAEQTSEIDVFSLSSNSHGMNFGGFKQHDLFSGQFSSPLTSAGTNIQQSGASSGRVAYVDATGGNSGDVSSAKLGSNVDEVEMLLSQMHDLSFMLESKLSVPPK